MISAFIPKRINYNGSQLTPLWAYKNFGLLGDSIVSFIGPCRIPFNLMLDAEDIRAKSQIYSSLMLHFIAEHFDTDLEKAVLRQRLLTAIVKEEIESRLDYKLKRIGDDLYDTIIKQKVIRGSFAASYIRASFTGSYTTGSRTASSTTGSKNTANSKRSRQNVKLSISIATASPVSTMIHFAVNIDSKHTPVLTVGLKDYKIDSKNFAGKIIQAYVDEMQSVRNARQKVYPTKKV